MSHGRETTTIFQSASSSFKKPQSSGRRTDQAVGSGALFGGSEKGAETARRKGAMLRWNATDISILARKGAGERKRAPTAKNRNELCRAAPLAIATRIPKTRDTVLRKRRLA